MTKYSLVLIVSLALIAASGGLSEAETHYNRGVERYQDGEPEPAIEEYDRAIELDPALAAADRGRGDAYLFLGNFEQAVAEFDLALELDADNAAAYSNRGLGHSALGNLEQAIADHDRAIELDPLLAAAYTNRRLVTQTGWGRRRRR